MCICRRKSVKDIVEWYCRAQLSYIQFTVAVCGWLGAGQYGGGLAAAGIVLGGGALLRHDGGGNRTAGAAWTQCGARARGRGCPPPGLQCINRRDKMDQQDHKQNHHSQQIPIKSCLVLR